MADRSVETSQRSVELQDHPEHASLLADVILCNTNHGDQPLGVRARRCLCQEHCEPTGAPKASTYALRVGVFEPDNSEIKKSFKRTISKCRKSSAMCLASVADAGARGGTTVDVQPFCPHGSIFRPSGGKHDGFLILDSLHEYMAFI